MQSSLVLYVVAYDECIRFYREVLGLPVLFDTDNLTCFQWGESSLMVEREDDPALIASRPASRSCIRFLVEDVAAEADKLSAQGLLVDHQVHAWGEVAKFHDPDGNLCAFKDLAGFREQCGDTASVQGSSAGRSSRRARIVAAGRTSFSVRYGVLGWGVSTAVLFSLYQGYSEGWDRFPLWLGMSLVIFPVGGWFWGIAMWRMVLRAKDGPPSSD